MRFPMRVCNEIYILKVTLYTLQHWRIKSSGFCTEWKDSDMAAVVWQWYLQVPFLP